MKCFHLSERGCELVFVELMKVADNFPFRIVLFLFVFFV